LGNGAVIRIVGEQASETTPYVQSMKVDGRNYESPWISWSALSDGASLDFSLEDKPCPWGNDPDKAPPSFDAISQ
jgi:putative alpha-1,2-mannosidase